MRIPSFDADRAIALVAVSTSLIVAVTCASGTQRPRLAAPAGDSPSQTAPSPPAAPLEISADAGAAGDAALEPPPPRPQGLTLSKFFAALGEASDRAKRVRVLWIGDSHTAADFLPHALRKPLQRRFGNGGPGFVSIGIDKYRHGGMVVKSEGKWRREPNNPASSNRNGDGVFGLAGVRAVPVSGDARTKIELMSGAVAGGARWELMYRAPQGARFNVKVDAAAEQRIDAGAGRAGPAGSPIRRARFESGARAALTVSAGAGSPELFGMVVESTTGGVVVDTLGINGARAATALAWDQSTWVAEARSREPALAIIAFGTNEAAGSGPSVDRYVEQLTALVARVRKAAPEADCLLLGPTDMADAEGRSLPRVAELDRATERAADQSSCAFFSLQRAMGGEGTIARWARETPPLAAADRVHLTAKGYEKVGALLATELLEAYDRFANSR